MESIVPVLVPAGQRSIESSTLPLLLSNLLSDPLTKEKLKKREHIYRQHQLPIFCTRCGSTFTQATDLVAHSRLALGCDLRGFDPPDGFTKEQERTLRRKRKFAGSEESKWRAMYKVLFPDDDEADMPSPCQRYHPAQFSQCSSANYVLQTTTRGATQPGNLDACKSSTTTNDTSGESYRALFASNSRSPRPNSQGLSRTNYVASSLKSSGMLSLNCFAGTDMPTPMPPTQARAPLRGCPLNPLKCPPSPARNCRAITSATQNLWTSTFRHFTPCRPSTRTASTR